MSHRHRLARDMSTVHSTSTWSGPQMSQQSRSLAEKMAVQSQRHSTTSVASSQRRSSSSVENVQQTRTSRPSGIPRSTSATSQARLQILAASRSAPTHPIRVRVIPSLPTRTTMLPPHEDEWFSGGRKPAPSQHHHFQQPDNASDSRSAPALDSDADSILGIAFPEKQFHTHDTNLSARLIPELRALATTSHPPALTSSSLSTISSPSTPFTDSPGPRSASTATTSTSWSSTSPCIMKSARSPAYGRRSNTVPIPSIPRPHMPSLPALRESLSVDTKSSESKSRNEVHTPVEKTRKKTPLNSPAPTPPPRSSSIKRSRSRSSSKSEAQPQKIEDVPPPLPREVQISPLAAYGTQHAANQRPGRPREIQNHHDNLQNAINSISATEPTSLGHNNNSTSFVTHAPATDFDSGEFKRLLEAADIVSGSKDANPGLNQPARSRLAKFSKMALFGRGLKDDSESRSKPQPRKLQRKGPAAGTGHEGYGKQSRRTRKVSTESNRAATDSEGFLSDATTRSTQSKVRQSSFNTTRPRRPSQSDLDDFAATRMKPVVILGGSQRSDPRSRNSLGYSSTSGTYSDLGQSSGPIDGDEPQKRPAPASDPLISKPWTSSSYSTSTDHSVSSQHTRRLAHYPRTSVASEPTRSTAPSQIPYTEGWNTSQSSVTPSTVALADTGNDLYRVDTKTLEQQRTKLKKSRWNIFRRKDAVIEPQARVPDRPKRPDSLGLTVEVSNLVDNKSVPYYAMLDSESDTQAAQAVGEFLTEAAHFLYADDEDDTEDVNTTRPQQTQRVASVLLPSAPYNSQENVKVKVKSHAAPLQNVNDLSALPQADSIGAYQRRPRLAQVGRIPRVVANEPNRHEFKSFSRPFTHATAGERSKDISMPVQIQVNDSRSSDKHISGSSDRQSSNLAYGFPAPSSNKTNHRPDISLKHFPSPEALQFGDRQSITSSSSEGVISVMGPPLIPLPDHRPRKSNPFMFEDIWNEYDDFIDHVTTPVHSPEDQEGPHTLKLARRLRRKPSFISTDAPSLPVLAKGLAIDTSYGSVPTIYASPELLQEADADHEVRLRRSRIISALHSSMDPASPFSIADYLGEQNEKFHVSNAPLGHSSDSTTNNNTPRSPHLLGPSVALPEVPSNQHHENVIQMNDVQRSRDPTKHAELSYASLMVSRWLSFGQVLFSPAHFEIRNQPGRHVLVIDGLGNEDWAMYCAVTYQSEQAYIYDLKETGSLRSFPVLKPSDNTPPNLRRREIANFSEPLKFPDNYFSAIVIRFPPVMAESRLKSMVAECRRVLAPGGHMELMLLDLDLVNMGVVTRRALRELKTKITIANPDVSLKPVIDNVQSVLCEKGFSKLSRCVVGVPVVGKPPTSVDSPTSSRSSGGSDRYRFGPAGPRPIDGFHEHGASNFSLNDLVADHSDNADAKISKTVSRTARSWWQHCFEAAIISDGNLSQSILSNKRVLAECKSRSSSFRLLIAYAQKSSKPAMEMKRRTMSEPVISTLKTS